MFRYQSKTGLPISTYFSATKIRWLLDNVKEIKEDINNVFIGTVDSWLTWNLTGGIKVMLIIILEWVAHN